MISHIGPSVGTLSPFLESARLVRQDADANAGRSGAEQRETERRAGKATGSGRLPQAASASLFPGFALNGPACGLSRDGIFEDGQRLAQPTRGFAMNLADSRLGDAEDLADLFQVHVLAVVK